jgi:hypothetical protein
VVRLTASRQELADFEVDIADVNASTPPHADDVFQPLLRKRAVIPS